MRHLFLLPCLLLPNLALAHGTAAESEDTSGDDAHDGLVLHEGDAYESCYIDLHGELSDEAFRTLTGEFGSVAFSPLASARSLGAGHFEFGVSYRALSLDDTTDAWNHGWSRPEAAHWLGPVQLPVLLGRVGSTDRLDAELMVSGDPQSNWMLGGVAVRGQLLTQDERVPVDLSVRGSFNHLFFADELGLESATVEVLAGRRFGPVSPYAGVGVTGALGIERSDDVDLDAALTANPQALLGAELALGPGRLVVEGVGTTRLSSLNFKLGLGF